MSGEVNRISSVAGSSIAGGARSDTSASASRTPSKMSSHAVCGCWFKAEYRLSDSLTSIARMPGQNGSASGPTY
jgi:hypothetical protein